MNSWDEGGAMGPDGANGAIGAGALGVGALLAPLAGVAGSMYDTYQSNKTARRNTDRTIAANKAEAELAYQRQVEMWNMQNAYNTPEAQMQRFIKAGLNPHLIYGQGNSGNASSFPQYQPPDIQYRYSAPTYGAAVSSVLPMLMQVGTWLQNMRLGEARMAQMTSSTERTDQLVSYLSQANPKLLESLDNKLSMYPYQKSMLDYNSVMARQKLAEFEQDFRYKYGEDLFKQMGSAFEPLSGRQADFAGTKRLDFLLKQAQLEQAGYKSKLLEAQSSWSDYDITNPQGIMQLVVSGVMGLAGAGIKGLRFNQNARKVTHELENRMPNGRVQIRRRSYNK